MFVTMINKFGSFLRAQNDCFSNFFGLTKYSGTNAACLSGRNNILKYDTEECPLYSGRILRNGVTISDGI